MLGMKDAFMQVEDNKLQPAESNGLKVVSFGFFAEQEHQAAIYQRSNHFWNSKTIFG